MTAAPIQVQRSVGSLKKIQARSATYGRRRNSKAAQTEASAAPRARANERCATVPRTPRAASQLRPSRLGQLQTKSAGTSDIGVPSSTIQATMAPALSVRARNFTVIAPMAANAAE